MLTAEQKARILDAVGWEFASGNLRPTCAQVTGADPRQLVFDYEPLGRTDEVLNVAVSTERNA
jgi:hypothetical protein